MEKKVLRRNERTQVCRAHGSTGLRSCSYALILVGFLVGCASAPERALKAEQEARQEQVERIVERTITTPGETVTEVLDKYIKLPKDLTAPCAITHNKDRSVGEYVRVANENTNSLEDCAKRMDSIRALQP